MIYYIKYPQMFFVAIPILIIIFFLVITTFIRFRTKEEKSSYIKSRKKIRLMMLITRTLIFLSLIAVIATPFILEQRETEGKPLITILLDNSTSFDLFDKTVAFELEEKLEKIIPTTVKYIATGNRSGIGDGIIANLHGNDNLILVTDGNNNYGKDLGDVMIFAADLNATINTLELKPIHDDTSVIITGPDEVVQGTETTFSVIVTQVGKEQIYKIRVKRGTEMILNKQITGSETFTFTRRLPVADHIIYAELEINDHFKENNFYYKTINVLKRPKIWVYSEKPAYLYDILMELYNFAREKNLPEDLNKYPTIIMDDININKISEADYERLADYVTEGNGLVIIGGNDSFDKGGYKNSLFETLLPVVSGEAKRQQAEDVNVVIVIDVSASTGISFGGGTATTKVDVEKALALGIIDDFRKDNKVGVVAFNTVAYIISELSPLNEKEDDIKKDISRLRGTGGTDITMGIVAAVDMLSGIHGSKNIILISDGVTLNPGLTISVVEEATKKGITTYSVGVGFDTYEELMKNIAYVGGGIYYKPAQSDRLKIIFGEPEDIEDNKMKLQILNFNHFITQGLNIDAVLYGYNVVAPKSSGSVLVTTLDGNPILTVWRFGLGRVAAITTDDGSQYAGQLLTETNSQLISKTINWAIGNPAKNLDFYIDAKDTTIDKPVNMIIKTKKEPVSNQVEFSKIDENLYSGMFSPESPGFYRFFDSAVVGVSNNDEYYTIGINPLLEDLVEMTGGKTFHPDNINDIVANARANARRVEELPHEVTWPLLLFAVIVFLIEVFVRRLFEDKKI